jgi:myo-inositol-1(or 4)-monophosphatase
MTPADRTEDLRRIRRGLRLAAEAVGPFTPGSVAWERKEHGGDPVTAADLAIDAVLREALPRPGEGWLSEETVDDRRRLEADRVWIVDPLDGTREFVEGIPEWCISIGLVEGGVPVAGGILNPATDQMVVGAVGAGVTLNGRHVALRPQGGPSGSLAGARVLASRSEVRRGEWARFADAPFEVIACGSVAYKLGQVAAGLADATWTLVPKNEWDVAGGAALIRAAGLHLCHADGTERVFNRADPLMPDFLAGPAPILDAFRAAWL